MAEAGAEEDAAVAAAEAELRGYLDREGRLLMWPSKGAKKLHAVRWMARLFSSGRTYSEREVNEILKSNHLFDDHALLRRELFEQGYLGRTPDGKSYWRQ